MITRKNFIKKGSLTALAGIALPALSSFGKTKGQQKTDSGDDQEIVASLPLVIATWDNKKATEAAMNKLKEGGSAVDAVEAGAMVPEGDPDDTSVGFGGFPDRDGIVTLDACIMDEKGNAGAVAFLQDFKHPVAIARKVMEKTPHVMLCGEGAARFALEQGFTKENLLTPKAKIAWEEWLKRNSYVPPVVDETNHDTIGILAMDQNANISGACSTSGWAFKFHGRVGDSPIIGAGLFVDNEVGAAVASGLGEFVMKTLGSFLIVELMRNGRTPQEATEEAIYRIIKKYNYKDMQIGYLAINKKGQHGSCAVKDGFSYTLFQDGENLKHEAPTLRP